MKKVEEELDTKLRLYRIKKADEFHVDQKNIFSDTAIDRLVTFKPKTLDDLENILPKIQIKLLGEDLLKIINDGEKRD